MTAQNAVDPSTETTRAFPLVPGLRPMVPGQFPWETDGDGMALLAEDARAVLLPYSMAGFAVDASLSADAHDAYVVDLADPDDAYDAAYGYTEGLDAYGSW